MRANGCVEDENFSESCIDILDQGVRFNYHGVGRWWNNINNFFSNDTIGIILK